MILVILVILVIENCGARWALGSGGWLEECVATDGWCSVGAGGAQCGLGGPTSTRRRLQITGSPNLQLPKHPVTQSGYQDVVGRN